MHPLKTSQLGEKMSYLMYSISHDNHVSVCMHLGLCMNMCANVWPCIIFINICALCTCPSLSASLQTQSHLLMCVYVAPCGGIYSRSRFSELPLNQNPMSHSLSSCCSPSPALDFSLLLKSSLDRTTWIGFLLQRKQSLFFPNSKCILPTEKSITINQISWRKK